MGGPSDSLQLKLQAKSLGDFGNGRRCFLVTDDKALPLFRQRLSVRLAIRDGDYSLFFMVTGSEVDNRIRDQEHRLVAIESWLQQATLARQVGDRSLADWEILRQAAEAAFLGGSTPAGSNEDLTESTPVKNSWIRGLCSACTGAAKAASGRATLGTV
jgi:hypothetical protein